MANNPNPVRVTDALWYFVESCLAMQPGTQNGGTYTDKPGYHNTRDNLYRQGRTNDYSVRLAADKQGPGDKTAAFDWTFPDAQQGRYGTIVRYGARVREAFRRRDPRLFGWREVLIQADPDTSAEGFDFVSWTERTPDSSHLWHGHFSVLRQYLNDYAVMNGMLSILRGDDDVDLSDKVPGTATSDHPNDRTVGQVYADLWRGVQTGAGDAYQDVMNKLEAVEGKIEALEIPAGGVTQEMLDLAVRRALRSIPGE